ncbi:MAG: hypothetical protein RSE41_06475 [Clostridia bacterium]
MKKYKILITLFILTLVCSKSNISGMVNTVYTIQNKLVPGAGYGYQTQTKYINSWQIAHHIISDVNITRTLDAKLYKTSPSTLNTSDKEVKNGLVTRLTENTTQDGPLYLATGDFYVILRSKVYHLGDTKINYLNWKTTDE